MAEPTIPAGKRGRRPRHSDTGRWLALPGPLSQPTARPCLMVVGEPRTLPLCELEPGRTLVMGRDESADIRLTDSAVSRQHARVWLNQGRVALRDLGSLNGTFVNGVRVRECVLADGDTIQAGNCVVRLRYADDLEARYQRHLVEAALRDPLTGLYNRRHFEEQLAVEVAAARRHSSPLALLMVDVDHFKLINDRYGHPAGDAVLHMVAGRLAEAARKEDLPARYGGDEFMVLARSTDLAGARRFAERLRRTVEHSICLWQGARLRVTISIGVTELRVTSSAQDLIPDVDRGVYQAKQAGRNRVAVAAWGEENAPLYAAYEDSASVH